MGRSIAVASSRGLCILDLSPISSNEAKMPMSSQSDSSPSSPCVSGHICTGELTTVPLGMKNTTTKWRLFRNEAEERSFRVLAMTWWERSAKKSSSEDLLVAIIEYIRPDDDPNISVASNQHHLVCWSRRRLGFGQYQLLGESDVALDNGRKEGIALPKGMTPSSISILAQPSGCVEGEGSRHGGLDSTRAVVLVTSPSQQGSTPYVAYQLQAIDSTPISVIDSIENRMTCQVFSRLCSTGKLPRMEESGEAVSPFLAGASFHFDLLNSGLDGNSTLAYIATVGLIGESGSLSAVSLTPFGPTFAGIVLTNSRGKSESNKRINNFWLSDVIKDYALQCTESKVMDNAFSWTLTRCDGKTFCWRVPFFVYGQVLPEACTDRVSELFRSFCIDYE